MNPKRIGIILTALIICLFAFTGLAAAAGFSADVHIISGKQVAQGKLYFGTDKVRMDISGIATITRFDRKMNYTLMHEQKMYMEQPLRIENTVPTKDPVPGEVERTYLGQEKVNGYDCNKYRITVKDEKTGKTSTILTWLLVDTFYPAKVAGEDGKWAVEYRNIQLGEPDPALFEIPAGYKKMSMNFGF